VNKHMYSADALEETAVFKAYNQAIDDAKSAIRGERVDDPSAAPTFINAIARKCSPHRYAAQIAVAMKSGTDLAYADGYANGFRHGMQSRQPVASPPETCPRCAGSGFESDGYTACDRCGGGGLTEPTAEQKGAI
jgi:hypothetical protein